MTLELRAYPTRTRRTFRASVRTGAPLHACSIGSHFSRLQCRTARRHASLCVFRRLSRRRSACAVGVPPATHEVPSTAVPRLAVLDGSPGLAAALGSGRPLCRVTLLIASTLYDGLRPRNAL
jgi:hypothetical protein